MFRLTQSDPNKLSRKCFLVPLAERFGVEHKRYRNRQLLVTGLLDKLRSHVMNECDPVTLEPISGIPGDRIVLWEQDGTVYAADINSLQSLIQSGHTINPWAIDKASGVYHAKNREDYMDRFDMQRIPGFIEFLCKYDSNRQQCTEFDKIPEHVVLRDTIEKVGNGLYISHVIDYCEQADVKKTITLLLNSLCDVIEQYVQHMRTPGVGSTDSEEMFRHFSYMDQICFGMSNKLQYHNFEANSMTGLEIAAQFFSTCDAVLTKNIIECIFDSADNIIKASAVD